MLQNLAILPENEEAIVEGGGIQVLLQHCSKGIGMEYDARDQPIIEAAALGLMNLAAGGEHTCKAIADLNGIPVLVGLLQIHPRRNIKTSVLEQPTPTLQVIHAAGAALRGIAMLPEMQGPLRSSGVIQHVGLLLERLLSENQWIPAILEGLQADALDSLLGLLRNMSLRDTGSATRNFCINARVGSSLGKLLSRLIPKEPPTPPVEIPSPSKTPTRARSAISNNPPSPSKEPQQQHGQSQVTIESSVLILECIAAARNLSAGLPPMQEQLGASASVEAVVALINNRSLLIHMSGLLWYT